MRCCVDFCINSPAGKGRSKSEGDSFYGFPREARLRSAWLRALGKQDCQLSDSAVVCSQHFLHDDISETKSGGRQLRPGAVPSTVLVCMICFKSNSKMFLMSQYNLEEAYEKLTGYPLCAGGNLKQTLCVQCAQQLRNFSRFREQSLRARCLMMELLEKHELITMQHIKMIDRVKYQLNNDFVLKTIEPDHWDLYIEENYDKNTHMDLEDLQSTEVNSGCDESVLIDEDMNSVDNVYYDDPLTLESIQEDTSQDSTKYLISWDHEYIAQDEGDDGEWPISAESNFGAAASSRCDSPQITASFTKDAPLSKTLTNSVDNKRLTTSKDVSYQAPNDSEKNSSFTCNVCGLDFDQKNLLVNHMKFHSKTEQFSCKLCPFESKDQSDLTTHNMQNHMIKDNARKLSEYKTKVKANSARQVNKHTGEKTFQCDLCEYKSNQKAFLKAHIGIHTVEKKFACELCKYKCKLKAYLVRHMKRTHNKQRRERFACVFCDYKFINKSTLESHNMKSHPGQTPFACELCDYKCAAEFSLDDHMSLHTREKTFACDLCEYKTDRRSLLDRHLSVHKSGELYACEFCEYKTEHKADLKVHIVRTHAGVEII